MVFDPYNIVVMLAASLFGLFVGAVPGPDRDDGDRAAGAGDVLHGADPGDRGDRHRDGDGDLLRRHSRLPDAHAGHAGVGRLHRRSLRDDAARARPRLALGAGLVFSAIGGLFGTAVLIVAAPTLAEFALKFSSFEYFWLVLMGLTCAVFMTSERPLKGFVSLLLGLLVACVGLSNPAGIPALHVRQHRADGRHRPDPADDRHVRDLGDHPLRRRHQPAAARSSTSRSATCSRACGG